MSRDDAARPASAAAESSYTMDRLGAFLAKVADRTPAPGGGAAAAVTVALAAALAEMSAWFSTSEQSPLDDFVLDAHRIRIRAGELADEDARAYGAVIAASAAGGDPELRAATLRGALRRATEVPGWICRLGADTAELAARLMADGNPNLRGDCATAVLLAEAASRAAAKLVAINAEMSGGDAHLVESARRDVARASAAAATIG